MSKYPILSALAFSSLIASASGADLQLSDPSAISSIISQGLSDTNQALLALNNGKLEWLGENTEAEKNAIAAPNLGDLLYNSTAGEFQIFDGTAWGPVGGTDSAADTIALIDSHFGNADWRTQDGFEIDTDSQALALDGTALSISNGNTVDLSSLSNSPALSGDPTAPDSPISDEDGSIANTKYVAEKIDSELAAVSSISLAYNSALTNDNDFSGIPHSGGIAGEAILEGDVVYRNFNDGLLYLADADDGSENSPARRPIGIAIEEAASGSGVSFLDRGYLKTDIWQWQDGPIFLDTVAGATTQTQPTGSVLPLGYAVTPNTMFVDVDYSGTADTDQSTSSSFETPVVSNEEGNNTTYSNGVYATAGKDKLIHVVSHESGTLPTVVNWDGMTMTSLGLESNTSGTTQQIQVWRSDQPGSTSAAITAIDGAASTDQFITFELDGVADGAPAVIVSDHSVTDQTSFSISITPSQEAGIVLIFSTTGDAITPIACSSGGATPVLTQATTSTTMSVFQHHPNSTAEQTYTFNWGGGSSVKRPTFIAAFFAARSL